jgi:hypothetical protein
LAANRQLICLLQSQLCLCLGVQHLPGTHSSQDGEAKLLAGQLPASSSGASLIAAETSGQQVPQALSQRARFTARDRKRTLTPPSHVHLPSHPPTCCSVMPLAARLSRVSMAFRMPEMLRGRPMGASAQKTDSFSHICEAYLQAGAVVTRRGTAVCVCVWGEER